MPLKQYVASKVAKNARIGGKFAFPTLEVYDPEGQLIYRGSDITANEKMFSMSRKGLSRGVRILSAAASLPEALSELVDKQTLHKIGRKNAFTYIAIDLEDCHACSIQEHRLSENKDSILRSGSNLIVLKVTKEGKE